MTGSSLCRTRTLANLLHREHAALCSLYPADTRSSPQPRAGGRRVQLPGGAAFDSRSRRSRNYELLDPTRREGVRCAARLHTRTHHLCLHARTPIPLSSLTVICVCWLGVQAAFDKCHYRVRHFGMVFISPYKSARTALCACCFLLVSRFSVMWVLVCGMCLEVVQCCISTQN